VKYIAAAVTFVSLLVALPLTGVFPVVRVPALLFPIVLALAVSHQPWRWGDAQYRALAAWQPTSRVVWTAGLLIGIVLFWIVLTRFQSGQINAVDFTVYFDRPTFQTWQGRPMFVETADAAGFSNRSQFAVHAYWIMVPLAGLYGIWATPMWLLALSVLAIVAGSYHVVRIVAQLGAGGVVAAAAGLAFVLNANTARVLNYGFHAEVLYAWFVPWLISAGLSRDRRGFLLATLACVSVKEDACLVLIAVATALALHRYRSWTVAERWWFLAMPLVVALGNLAIYYCLVVPALTLDGRPTYAAFWSNYGATPVDALWGMLRHPGAIVWGAVSSGFFRHVMVPHLFLPLVGWRWVVGLLPTVVIYGASANPQLRAYGLYYSVVVLPFLVIGSAAGVLAIVRWWGMSSARGHVMAAATLVFGALVVGSTTEGYSLRPWKAPLREVPAAIRAVPDSQLVLVQSGLYPFAGYQSRVQLLTPETRAQAAGTSTVLLVSPLVSAYPFSREEHDDLLDLPRVQANLPDGLIAVRVPAATGR
jgi:uncharacterized membrane protein